MGIDLLSTNLAMPMPKDTATGLEAQRCGRDWQWVWRQVRLVAILVETLEPGNRPMAYWQIPSVLCCILTDVDFIGVSLGFKLIGHNRAITSGYILGNPQAFPCQGQIAQW
jgi:hypothetical protein